MTTPPTTDDKQDALWELNDELNSMLHAQQLRSELVPSSTVTEWLRLLHNIVRRGLNEGET